MKRLSVCALASLGVLTVAATGAAGDPPGPVGPQPPHPGTLLTSRIVSLGKGPPDASGNWQVDVTVQNLSNAPRKLNLGLHGPGVSAAVNTQTSDVAGGQTHHFFFVDTQGGPPTCGLNPSKEYDMYLADDGVGSTHHAILRASNCSFQTTIQNPWDSLTPDHKQSLETNSVYVSQAHVLTPQTCSTPLKVQAQVANHTLKVENGLRVSLNEGANINAAVTGVNVTPNNVTDVTLSATVPIMVSGSIRLDGGTSEQQSAIVVKVISSCTYSSQVDPPAEARAVLR